MPAVIELTDLASEILARTGQQPRLVGIDGPSGSGKSTLSRRLAAQLGDVTLLWLDDFVSWTDFSGWWPRFEAELLTPLVGGSAPVPYQVRDWKNDEFGASLGPWKTAVPAPTIILDGVTSTRREVADRLTYRIWVEAPRPVRLARGIERDGESHRQLWLDWMQLEDDFFIADRTRERADLRIDSAATDLAGTAVAVLA